MLDYLSSYIQQIWGSTLPHRLAWAICVAIVFEALVWLVRRRLRRALSPILQQDAFLEAPERVRRRRVVLGLPLLVTRAVLYGLGLMIILRYLGFNTSAELVPLIAVLLVIGAAIGWRCLQDIMAGYFIVYDNLYATGDRVTIGDFSGIVVDIGLRYTRLKAPDGREISIANHTITHVVNHTRATETQRPGLR